MKLKKTAEKISRKQHAAAIRAPGHVIHIAGAAMPVVTVWLAFNSCVTFRRDRRIWRGLSNETDDTLDRPMIHRQALYAPQADGLVFCKNVLENLPQKKKTGSRNRQLPALSSSQQRR